MKILCPICGKPLERKDRTASCESRHSFDYARSGYLNLLVSQKAAHGDDAEMVKARTAFLEKGYYSFLKEELSSEARQQPVSSTVDLGCGEGTYTIALPGEERFGIDLSKDALKHAAKEDTHTQYLLASIFHLPLADDSMDLAVTCFAPAAVAEIERVLKPGGRFLYVTPGPDHLIELKQVLYPHPYQNEVKQLDTAMTLASQTVISQRFTADAKDLFNLFRMTPYAWKTGREGTEKLSKVSSLEITAQFVLRIYHKA